jgi:hypothetical protein
VVPAAGVFVVAALLLALEARSVDRTFLATVDTLRNLPAYGFAFAALFFVGHLVRGGSAQSDRGRRVGHAFNAFVIAAMTSSMIYNTSFIHFSPFYYNNPEILVALLFSFIVLDRARIPKVAFAVFVVSLLPVFGMKLNRALSADTLVARGNWAGMRVNYRGVELLRASTRVRELAGPDETVLVLPEDVELVGLIGRPRPPLTGAILFVDQYPRRLLEHDIEAIDDNPPKVIVIHPRRRNDWHTLFNTWSKNSAARELLDYVLDHVLPGRYRLDSSYSTIYFWDQGQLDVYVRQDEERDE